MKRLDLRVPEHVHKVRELRHKEKLSPEELKLLARKGEIRDVLEYILLQMRGV